jgi:hypothetical protein
MGTDKHKPYPSVRLKEKDYIMPLSRSLLPAALIVIAALHAVMLAALFFDVAPHPPRTIVLFAMAPFLAVVIGLAMATLRQIAHDAAGARGLSVTVALLTLLSFGPQKYLDPALPEIWPAVVSAQLSVIVIAITLIQPRRVNPSA